MPLRCTAMSAAGVEGTRLRRWLEATEGVVEVGAKGWPPRAWGRTAAEVSSLGLRVGDLPTPVVTLDLEAVQHNVRRMARYCQERGVELAPHAKTSLAPAIMRLQLEEGAWGMTAATWHQAMLLHAAGCRRILLANQLLEESALRWAAGVGRAGQGEILCYVDSLAGVEIAETALAGTPAGAPLGVLVELGLGQGRTGARTAADALAVARAVAGSAQLRLRGVAGYEGIAVTDRSEAELARVRAFLSELRDVARRCLAEGLIGGESPEALVTAGGSAVFDEVVDALAAPGLGLEGVRVVLRSGCYASHDSGFYERTSPLATTSRAGEPLRPALALRGRVLSRPERGRAVADFGKRDTSFDMGMPVVQRVWRTGTPLGDGARGLAVVELYDQHALLDVGEDHPLAAGDVVECGVSHPCTTFDRWRSMPVVEGDDRVTGVVRTYF